MRKILLKAGIAVAALSALLAPATAKADGLPLTLKAEPGVAIPLTSPQSDRFGVGADLTVKPLIGLTPWLVAGPSVSILGLPSSISGVDAGTAFRLGGTAELRRPRDASNTGTGFSAVSPWVSAELQYVRTDGLDRVAPSLAVGAAVPTGADRQLWVGPFVKYLDVVQSLADRPGYDNSDAKVLILGVSFELGGATKKAEPAAPPPAEVKKELPKTETPKKAPPPQPVTVTETFHGIVQFPFDSSTPLPESTPILKEALKLLSENAGLKVTLEGHACSLGAAAYNQKLSERRAQAVKDYLVKNGIAADRLTVKGYGEDRPVTDNKTDAARRLNRRVEYTVTVTVTKEGAK